MDELDDLDARIIFELAENRMNVCEVGRVLYAHRNTIGYRIKKIKRLTGLDPLDFYDLHRLVGVISRRKYYG